MSQDPPSTASAGATPSGAGEHPPTTAATPSGGSEDPPITRLGGTTPWEGSQFSVRVERFQHADGEVVEREQVRRVDAAAVVAYDEEHVWLVRQPREAIGRYTLEIPAGKLDVDGESARETAQRELAEEIGKRADDWADVVCFHPSSGYTDELVHVFAATGLRPADGVDPDPAERIEIVPWPLTDLDGALAATTDAKTIIGLQWLRSTL